MASLTSVLRRVRAALSPVGRAPVPPTQPATVAEAVARLRAAGEGLDGSDGVGHFNRMYLRVTELVAQRLEDRAFENPGFMERLDVVFAGLYLEAVEAPGQPRSPAWRPLFEQRRRAGVTPLQFAVAGMNAHINHDLALATVRTCRQLGMHPGSRGVYADYLKVNALLAGVHEQVRQSLLGGVVLDLDREASPLLNLVGSWSISRARDAAWQQALVLWELRASPELTRSYLDALARSVGLVTRQLLTPLDQAG